MKKIYRTITALLLCIALLCPTLDAQTRGRDRGGGGGNRTHQPASRPGQGGNSHGNRPGQGSRPTQPNRPSQGNNNRPGQGNHNRPSQGNNNRPGNRPGQGNHNRPPQQNWRPGNDRPGGPGGPGYRHDRPPRPDHSYRPGGHHGPMRPHMRPPRPFHRPVPPPAWRPMPGWRPFHSILGVTLGTAFNISINALINSGYTVSSYGNNQIYLNNVPMLNLMWPDAIMYYNPAGQLYGSQFVYSSPGYNMTQYNMAYTSLANAYGAPYSLQNVANGIEASWWGPDNQFIRLSYVSDYANNGSLRYYTTLSFGN